MGRTVEVELIFLRYRTLAFLHAPVLSLLMWVKQQTKTTVLSNLNLIKKKKKEHTPNKYSTKLKLEGKNKFVLLRKEEKCLKYRKKKLKPIKLNETKTF